jgi:hypothetical protein
MINNEISPTRIQISSAASLTSGKFRGNPSYKRLWAHSTRLSPSECLDCADGEAGASVAEEMTALRTRRAQKMCPYVGNI